MSIGRGIPRPCECGHDYSEHGKRGSRPCDHDGVVPKDPANYCTCEAFFDAMSYGETGTLTQLAFFIRWMQDIGAVLPNTNAEIQALLRRWLIHHRAEEAKMVRFLTRNPAKQ